MTQHYVFHERFDTPTGYAWKVGTVCLTEAEAHHVGMWLMERKPPAAFSPVIPPGHDSVGNGPPNCMDSGYALAQAQHEAAESGDQCTAGACLLTRGSD